MREHVRYYVHRNVRTLVLARLALDHALSLLTRAPALHLRDFIHIYCDVDRAARVQRESKQLDALGAIMRSVQRAQMSM